LALLADLIKPAATARFKTEKITELLSLIIYWLSLGYLVLTVILFQTALFLDAKSRYCINRCRLLLKVAVSDKRFP